MNVSIFQAAAALHANSRWQEVIAENIAASSIPGFKRQELSFDAVQAGAMPAGASRFVLPRAGTHTNFQTGPMKYTGVKTDLAIEGPGFFEVRLPNGAPGFTRDGEFHVNTLGQLVTMDGHAVLGVTGPIQLDPNDAAPLSISATGEISQGSEIKGQLKLVAFNDPQWLTPISGGYFLGNNPSLQIKPVTDPALRQGYLEGANSSPIAEMAHLITAMRMFEANQRVLQAQDDRMGQAIAALGSVGG
jgi:flagellar basal body rod protein FlgG